MVVLWSNSDGSITLSQRTGTGHVLPSVDSSPSRVATVQDSASDVRGSPFSGHHTKSNLLASSCPRRQLPSQSLHSPCPSVHTLLAFHIDKYLHYRRFRSERLERKTSFGPLELQTLAPPLPAPVLPSTTIQVLPPSTSLGHSVRGRPLLPVLPPLAEAEVAAEVTAEVTAEMIVMVEPHGR